MSISSWITIIFKVLIVLLVLKILAYLYKISSLSLLALSLGKSLGMQGRFLLEFNDEVVWIGHISGENKVFVIVKVIWSILKT